MVENDLNHSGINFDIRDHSHQGLLGKVLKHIRTKSTEIVIIQIIT